MRDMWHLNNVLHFRSTQLHSHSILKYKTTINTTQDNLEASAKNVTPQPTNISHYNFNYQLKNIQPNPRPKTHCIVWLQHKPAGLLLTLNQDDPASFHPQSIKACTTMPYPNSWGQFVWRHFLYFEESVYWYLILICTVSLDFILRPDPYPAV